MSTQFDRFDICEAFHLLESDYNVSGLLQERPSNQRRNESVGVQLHRMKFKPRPKLGAFDDLTENAKEIYIHWAREWKLPNPKGDRIVRLLQGERSPNFCFSLVDAYTGEDVVFVQTDWDYPGLASRFGYVPCVCGATDGTVDCAHKTASQMIAGAFDWLEEHAGDAIRCGDYD